MFFREAKGRRVVGCRINCRMRPLSWYKTVNVAKGKAMSREQFDLILSSTGTLTVPSSVLEQINAAIGNGATSVTVLRFESGKGELQIQYEQEIAEAIQVIEGVREDFADTLAALAK
jgi:hypothetical protein